MVPCRRWDWVRGALTSWSSRLLSLGVLAPLRVVLEVLLPFGSRRGCCSSLGLSVDWPGVA